MAAINTTFCLLKFNNPFILPSGIITEISEHKKAIEAGVGGVTLKSITFHKREGNALPRMWKYECGLLNSVGLRNAGIDKAKNEVELFLKTYPETPTIVSLFATKIPEFVSLVEAIVPLNPPLIELNLSCPNVDTEFGKPLGMDKGAAGKIVKAAKKVSGNVPILAKLSPNVSDIGEIAKVCEGEGADGIVAINTSGPGMLIDIKRRKPYLGAKKGGISGPAILPLSIGCVYEIYEAVKIPIIGMGGVVTVTDVIQMLLSGATLIGVGTATYTKGMGVYKTLSSELSDYMDQEKIKSVAELVGKAH